MVESDGRIQNRKFDDWWKPARKTRKKNTKNGATQKFEVPTIFKVMIMH
jgi:hypothetical protein